MADLVDYDGLKQLLNDPNISLTELDQLTDQERAILMQIINEFSSNGNSKALQSLWYEDYDEIPVDIDTFLDDPMYFGDVVGGTIYPYWRNMLREIFSPGAKYFEVIFSCFTSDTEILLADSKAAMKIKDVVNYLKIHDSIDILSFDEHSNKYVVSKCVSGVMNSCRPTYEVHLSDGSSFKATKEHKVLMLDGTWEEIGNLVTGDMFKTVFDDINHNLRVINKEYVATLLPVYDLEVENTHNFILKSGVIAHNCSIGVGKSTIADVAIAYMLHKLLCLKNPQAYYGLTKSSLMTINFFNITKELAMSVSYGKFQSMITKSPWFLDHGMLVGRTNKQYVPGKGIQLKIGASAKDAIGMDVFCITGDTCILTDNGVCPIEDLENKVIRVYQYNSCLDKIELSQFCIVVNTNEVTELICIELDDGTVIKCTPNHLVMTSEYVYKRADELTDDDELLLISDTLLAC